MTRWQMTMTEPSLEDLLDDEVMDQVLRSARLDAAQLRARLADLARNLAPAGPRQLVRQRATSDAGCEAAAKSRLALLGC